MEKYGSKKRQKIRNIPDFARLRAAETLSTGPNSWTKAYMANPQKQRNIYTILAYKLLHVHIQVKREEQNTFNRMQT
eukprot:3000843-Amphidinium_carterae.1